MIKSFKNKQLKKLFIGGVVKGIQVGHLNKIERILDLLDSTKEIGDMNFPGSGLHQLAPKNADKWAVKVSANWRLVFVFRSGDAYDVDYLDCH